MYSFPINKAIDNDCCVDAMHVHACGLLQVQGWQRPASRALLSDLSVSINGARQIHSQMYRHERPDVSAGSACGFYWEARIEPATINEIAVFWSGERLLFRGDISIACSVPPYVDLRSTDRVLHRDNIYGFGPPSPVTSDFVFGLARRLGGPVLDFGCGMGALMSRLLTEGLDVRGLEIDRGPIHENLPAELLPRVTLYDGSLPTPFPDKCFESVVCSEVLEHIPDYEAVIREIARLCRSEFLATVPDIGVIPLLHKHNVVPWHLLESTHVNFFNQTSLGNLLRRYFESVQFFRSGPCAINGTPYFEGLAALCRSPLPPT